jgi:Xaa-Pro aminopeptidase
MFDTGFHWEEVEILRDDYLWIDMAMHYKGYWADNGRSFQVGPVTEAWRKGYDTMYKAFDAVVDVAKPGVPAKKLWEALAKVEQDAGYPPIEIAGHGTGLDLHEPPILSPTNETILEPGMVFEVEPAVLPGWRKFGGLGVLHYENMVIINEKGCEVTHGLRRGIIQVNHPFD